MKQSSPLLSAILSAKPALSVVSGLLLGSGWFLPQFWIIWVALVPLIIAVKKAENLKDVLLLTTLTGVVSGVMQHWWIISAVQRYTGVESASGYLGLLLFTLFSCFWLFVAFGSFHLAVKKRFSAANSSVLLSVLLFALIYFLTDFLRIHLFPGLVWDKLTLVSYPAMSIYAMQAAPVIGSLGVGIIIAGVNYLVAEAFASRNVKFALIAGAVFLVNLGYGWAVIEIGGGHRTSGSGPKVAIITGNVAAETKWEEQGNEIITRMLGLVEDANREQPDLMIWPETALPWTYLEDDEILLEISRLTDRYPTQHIIGYLTESSSENQVYNSAYLIDSDAATLGRYDKIRLLDFAEKTSSLGGFLQRGESGASYPFLPGKQIQTLRTTSGNARVMICNESLLPWYFHAPDTDAEFLVNMSNNAWFDQDRLRLDFHVQLAAYRALEYRKDMIVSSNRGVSGFINRYGITVSTSQSESPELLTSHINPNPKKTPFARFPLLMPILAVLAIAVLLKTK